MKLLPLLATAKRKKYEKITQLCVFLQKHGVDINKPDQQGYTVLHEALIKKCGGRKHLPLVIMTLLNLGANISQPPENSATRNTTTFHLACATGLTQVVRQLIHHMRKSDPKKLADMVVTPTRDNLSAKQIAEQCGDLKMVEEIEAVIAHICPLYATTQTGNGNVTTPLRPNAFTPSRSSRTDYKIGRRDSGRSTHV